MYIKTRKGNPLSERVSLIKSICIVVEVALYENDGSTLVARAGCEVAERADKVGELTGVVP